MSAWTDLGALATGGALAFAFGGGIAMLLAQLPLRPQPLPQPHHGLEPRARPAPQPRPCAPARLRVPSTPLCAGRVTPACCSRPALAAA
jgi:hypothetical protein